MKQVKCKVVMIPTKKATENCIMSVPDPNGKPDWLKVNKDKSGYRPISFKPYHLYILSDEGIIDPCWAYSFHDNSIEHLSALQVKCHRTENWLKVIASTDPELNLPRPSNSFLEKYCELGDITEVMVEYENYWRDAFTGTPPKKSRVKFPNEWRLKVAKDDTITIRAIKSTYTRDEHIEDVRRLINLYATTYIDGDITNWIKQNL